MEKESNSNCNFNDNTKPEQINPNGNEVGKEGNDEGQLNSNEKDKVNVKKEGNLNSNEDQVDKQLNDNIELNKQNESNNQRSTNNELNPKQRESNGTEEKKTDNDLLENLSNDSFERKFNMLYEKLFHRPGRVMITTEDRLNLNMNSKGLTVNPKLEEIFAMIEAKDFKRELRDLNKRPDNIPPDTRNNKFEIKNIHNYSPLLRLRHLSQNHDKKMTYTSVIQESHNIPSFKYDQLKSKLQSAYQGVIEKKEKKLPPSITNEKIVPKKRDPLFNKDYFKAELTSLNQKLFGNEFNKNKKGRVNKETFYL